MTRFVIVVDTQRDFMAADGALSVPGAETLVEPMRQWLTALHPEETAGVLFTFDTHVPEVYAGSPESQAFPIHCVRGSAGWANMLDPAEVDAAIPVYRIEKGVFDMWAEPGLMIEPAQGVAVPRDAFFDGLAVQGIGEVAVIGVAADYCVRWAIDGLVARGFDTVVPAGLTKGIARPIEQVLADDFPAAAVRIQ
jgi:nicotinamidase/pyrazinamidase